jgi:hypothetical protein
MCYNCVYDCCRQTRNVPCYNMGHNTWFTINQRSPRFAFDHNGATCQWQRRYYWVTCWYLYRLLPNWRPNVDNPLSSMYERTIYSHNTVPSSNDNIIFPVRCSNISDTSAGHARHLRTGWRVVRVQHGVVMMNNMAARRVGWRHTLVCIIMWSTRTWCWLALWVALLAGSLLNSSTYGLVKN